MINEYHDDKPLGEFIAHRRKELKLTLKDLSQYCSVSINFLSLVERGKKFPSDSVLQKLEIKLQLKSGTLFSKVNKVSPTVVDAIISERHSGLHELLEELMKNKIKDDSLRDELIKEVYSVYEDFLDRHNLK